MNISYGTIMKIKINDDYEIVTLINNSSGADGFNCKVLDLSTFEILSDYKNIKDFKSNNNIEEILGYLDIYEVIK